MSLPAYIPVAESGSPCPNCGAPVHVTHVEDGPFLLVATWCRDTGHFYKTCRWSGEIVVIERIGLLIA